MSRLESSINSNSCRQFTKRTWVLLRVLAEIGSGNYFEVRSCHCVVVIALVLDSVYHFIFDDAEFER